MQQWVVDYRDIDDRWQSTNVKADTYEEALSKAKKKTKATILKVQKIGSVSDISDAIANFR